MELGFGEIVVILVVVLLLFGPSKLPQLGDSLGRAIRNFKRATNSDEEPTASPADPERPQPALPDHPSAAPSASRPSAAEEPERPPR